MNTSPSLFIFQNPPASHIFKKFTMEKMFSQQITYHVPILGSASTSFVANVFAGRLVVYLCVDLAICHAVDAAHFGGICRKMSIRLIMTYA